MFNEHYYYKIVMGATPLLTNPMKFEFIPSAASIYYSFNHFRYFSDDHSASLNKYDPISYYYNLGHKYLNNLGDAQFVI